MNNILNFKPSYASFGAGYFLNHEKEQIDVMLALSQYGDLPYGFPENGTKKVDYDSSTPPCSIPTGEGMMMVVAVVFLTTFIILKKRATEESPRQQKRIRSRK